LCAFPERENVSLNLIQEKIGFEAKLVILKEKVKIVIFCIRESFFASKTCAIDFSHKITHGRMVSKLKNAKNKNNHFRFKTIFP
jgi:hypothetical protein